MMVIMMRTMTIKMIIIMTITMIMINSEENRTDRTVLSPAHKKG